MFNLSDQQDILLPLSWDFQGKLSLFLFQFLSNESRSTKQDLNLKINNFNSSSFVRSDFF